MIANHESKRNQTTIMKKALKLKNFCPYDKVGRKEQCIK